MLRGQLIIKCLSDEFSTRALDGVSLMYLPKKFEIELVKGRLAIEATTIKRLGLKPGDKSIRTIVQSSENVSFDVKVAKLDGTGWSTANALKSTLGQQVSFHVVAPKKVSKAQVEKALERDDVHTLDLGATRLEDIGAASMLDTILSSSSIETVVVPLSSSHTLDDVLRAVSPECWVKHLKLKHTELE